MPYEKACIGEERDIMSDVHLQRKGAWIGQVKLAIQYYFEPIQICRDGSMIVFRIQKVCMFRTSVYRMYHYSVTSRVAVWSREAEALERIAVDCHFASQIRCESLISKDPGQGLRRDLPIFSIQLPLLTHRDRCMRQVGTESGSARAFRLCPRPLQRFAPGPSDCEP
jgi:hypothetical protein